MVWLEILFTANKKSLDYFNPLCNIHEFQDGGFWFVKALRGKVWANVHLCNSKYKINRFWEETDVGVIDMQQTTA